MDPNAQPPTQTQVSPPEGSKSNALLALISVFILLGVVGITLFLYLQNKSNNRGTLNKESENGKVSTSTKSVENVQKHSENGCVIFRSIDESLKNPNSVCVLDLSNQKINKLPQNIASLKNLKEIYLNNNNMHEFPAEILQLKHLVRIDMQNNLITKLPENISNLTNLEILNLANNSLTSLPEGITQLTKLNSLILINNKFTTTEKQKTINMLTNVKVLF